MHDNKGTLVRVKMQDDKSDNHLLLKPNLTPPDGGQHLFTFSVDIDTTDMPDGLRQFRFYADILHSNGNTQTARSSWPVDVENGKSDDNVTGAAAKVRYMNWYKVADPFRDWGYTGPIIGWDGDQLEVKCVNNGGLAIDRTFVHLNPDFHAGSEGTVLLNVAGAFDGNVDIPPALLNGPADKAVVRCQQIDGDERHEGVGVYPLD